MESSKGTLINSISKNIDKRIILGIKPSTSFSLYSVINKYIDYCINKDEIIYNKRATILRSKLKDLQIKCKDIVPFKLKEEYVYHLKKLDNIKAPLYFEYISTSDFITNSKLSIPLTFHIESDDLLFNGKSNILTNSPTIKVEHRYIYYPISDKESIKVNKLIDDNIKALGYLPYNNEEDSLIYKHSITNKEIQILGSIVNNNTIETKIKVKINTEYDGKLYISDSVVYTYISELTVDPNEGDINSVENIYIKSISSKESEYKEVQFNLNGKTLEIDNLHSITFLSKFLIYTKNKVSLSNNYSYEWGDNKLLAIPKDVYKLQDIGYTIETINDNSLELSYIREDGNKESIEFPIYNITDSLLMRYRVYENDLPSVEHSIKFIVTPNTITNEADTNNISYIDYDSKD